MPARKVPELCVPYNPASNTSNGSDPVTAHRLERLETVLSYVVRHHGGLWGYKDIKDWMHGMYLVAHLMIDEPFSRLFPSTPTGTPRPAETPAIPDDDETGDELERIGQLQGVPESVRHW